MSYELPDHITKTFIEINILNTHLDSLNSQNAELKQEIDNAEKKYKSYVKSMIDASETINKINPVCKNLINNITRELTIADNDLNDVYNAVTILIKEHENSLKNIKNLQSQIKSIFPDVIIIPVNYSSSYEYVIESYSLFNSQVYKGELIIINNIEDIYKDYPEITIESILSKM